MTRKLLFFYHLLTITTLYAQDTLYIYDVAGASAAQRILPHFPNTISDSADYSPGLRGVTPMPVNAPAGAYPGTHFFILRNASAYYTFFNFPFTAVTSIHYGFNITAAMVSPHLLLVFYFDVFNTNPPYWRNLSANFPCFENGTIQYGYTALTPVRYYTVNHPSALPQDIALVEVAENIGDSTGYFGFAFNDALHAYDSLLLYNLSYPAEGYPLFYSDTVNGDTLCMKYGRITYPDSPQFEAYWGGNGEYTSPYFDQQFRIRGMRWSYNQNYKISSPDFYFMKYVIDSVASGISKNTNEKSWTVFPNPVQNKITIAFHNPITSQAVICITDLAGQTVTSVIFPAGSMKKEFDISSLASGIYFITAVSKEFTIAAKMVKQ